MNKLNTLRIITSNAWRTDLLFLSLLLFPVLSKLLIGKHIILKDCKKSQLKCLSSMNNNQICGKVLNSLKYLSYIETRSHQFQLLLRQNEWKKVKRNGWRKIKK